MEVHGEGVLVSHRGIWGGFMEYIYIYIYIFNE
jgi:hypothetical protein